jgi:predicted NAD-dependent protein-ADP-ribosyltransferase YbiA (DUF1768 family)
VKNNDAEKAEVVRTAFFAKFRQNGQLAKKLLETSDAILYEDSPDDLFWGAKGQNMIGKLVMEVRDALKKEDGQ